MDPRNAVESAHVLFSHGRVKVCRTSQASAFSAADGLSGAIGTSIGKILAPAWYLPFGNGAAYPRMALKSGEASARKEWGQDARFPC